MIGPKALGPRPWVILEHAPDDISGLCLAAV